MNLVKIFGDPFFVGKTASFPAFLSNILKTFTFRLSLTSFPISIASLENLLILFPSLMVVSSPSVLVSGSDPILSTMFFNCISVINKALVNLSYRMDS